jgi:uncharacterized protein (DUF1800 family)
MKFLTRSAVALLALVTLSAAGPGPAIPSRPDDKTILHVLNRLGFGARPGDVARVREMGLAKYIDEQLTPERIPDTAMTARLAEFDTLTLSSRAIAQDYYMPAQMARRQAQLANRNQPANPANNEMKPAADPQKEPRTPEQMEAARKQREVVVDLTSQKILRAAYSDRQLQEVMTDFWFNHFNVFAGKGATQQYLTEYERDAIRPRVLGKFRDLLGATAKSPAMLFYLDNWQSVDPEAGERMAAQRMRAQQRFGFRMPPQTRNPNGQPPQQPQKRGLNENYGRELMELHTLGVDGGYTQQDVVNVARAFTGWTIDQPRQGGGFRFEMRLHDDREKIVLGHKIRGGGGQADGEQVLDILAKHPSTARFIATKLARRFVSDTPPPALVDRAAATFRETDGDIRQVVRTIVTSQEFFAAEAYRAKVKTPFEFVVSAVRATGTDVVDATPLVQAVRQLGMPLYMCQPPTGYADRGDAWVNTGALLNRMNFAVQLVSGRMRAVRTGNAPAGAALGGDISDTTAATIAKASDPAQVAALTLGSPEFQRR